VNVTVLEVHVSVSVGVPERGEAVPRSVTVVVMLTVRVGNGLMVLVFVSANDTVREVLCDKVGGVEAVTAGVKLQVTDGVWVSD
jgi:hypothetical protein